MRLFGLIGRTLKHSASPAYYEQKFQQAGLQDCAYRLFELTSIEELPAFLTEHPYLEGFNVTFPYKESIIPFLHHIDDDARQIGAVNVVSVTYEEDEIILAGHNSDWQGFHATLIGKELPKRALILGTGGASRAVVYALQKLGISYQLVSRHKNHETLCYDDIDETCLRNHGLIVNSTPLGTAGLHDNECPPLPYHLLTPDHFLYDLVYNPAQTLFLRQGADRGCQTMNGLPMLHAQADISWDIFNRNLLK
ncbi:MAG: shikimate dehydrogenase [Bacteroidales bacterium]|nr:shikimate dehydrogenase [Bacteroidales bacterium]